MTDELREKLRREHRVRLVTVKEEGNRISWLPAGVYGFTYAPLGETPLFERRAFHSFEVHKTADGESHILVYVTPAHAEVLGAATAPVDLHLFPDAWEEATELVSIPVSRISTKKLLTSREPGNWVAATVYPA